MRGEKRQGGERWGWVIRSDADDDNDEERYGGGRGGGGGGMITRGRVEGI